MSEFVDNLEEVFDDPEIAREWGVRTFEAALRSRKK